MEEEPTQELLLILGGLGEKFGFPTPKHWSICYALDNGWIQDCKWLLSEKAGYDVGTPEAVAEVLKSRPNDFLDQTQRPFDENSAKQLRKWLIGGYLLGTNFRRPFFRGEGIVSDEQGANQLEGELKRYWALRHGIENPSTVSVTREIVDDFCARYDLECLAEKFSEKLGL